MRDLCGDERTRLTRRLEPAAVQFRCAGSEAPSDASRQRVTPQTGVDAGATKNGTTVRGDVVRVANGVENAADTGVDESARARGRTAGVGARFKSHDAGRTVHIEATFPGG